MPRRPVPLGDSHNFGRRVSATATHVHKPRSLAWERSLLSSRSPLRRVLAHAAHEEGLGRHAFSFLPDLAFSLSRSSLGGMVERLTLTPLGRLDSRGRHEFSVIVGRSLALWSWLGVSDLHWENLVLGRDANEAIVFGPVDIEMILDDLELPTQTKLLPSADPDIAEVCRHAAGIRRALPFLGKPVGAPHVVSILSAYRRTLALLDRHSRSIAAVIGAIPNLRATPIRVCLRGTDDYVRARTEPVWPPLLDAESEQLMRGDIPYFFRLVGRRGIHFYGDASLRSIRTLPMRGDVPTLEPLLPLARGLRSPRRRTLQETGLFAIVGALDHIGMDGDHEGDGLALSIRARRIRIRLDDGTQLESPRNLRALVESAYLPCACGEVRTPFVPTVTRCRATPP